MNERIEKLLEQCQIETYGVNGELLEIGFAAEKFAELIVRECAYIARQCYTVRAVEAEDVAKHIEETFRS
jgi:hypothetical protein